MIRRLRKRHRLACTVLFPILAILLAAALLSRPAPPLADGLPNATEYGEQALEEAPRELGFASRAFLQKAGGDAGAPSVQSHR